MKRKTSDFYKELKDLRDRYGETEYSRDDILPATMALLRSHGIDETDLLRDHANSILDTAEKAEDQAALGFFPFDAHIALGEKHRIKRGAMVMAQVHRRKRIVDKNKAAQDEAWIRETRWLNDAEDALDGRAPDTKVREVLPEKPEGKKGEAA